MIQTYNLQQQTGYLSIISIPGGAKMFIDGIEQINTIPSIINLSPDMYID